MARNKLWRKPKIRNLFNFQIFVKNEKQDHFVLHSKLVKVINFKLFPYFYYAFDPLSTSKNLEGWLLCNPSLLLILGNLLLFFSLRGIDVLSESVKKIAKNLKKN